MRLEKILEEAGSARPGYELSSFKEAGLPVYLLTVRVLTLEHKLLGPIDEGILKALAAGLRTADEIAAFLGLSTHVLTSAFTGLNRLELINYTRTRGDSKAKLLITSKGTHVLEAAETIVPLERTIRICFDAITHRLLVISPTALYKPSEMRELGYCEIPAGASKRPEVEDISLKDFDRVLASQNSDRERSSDLLAIRRIDRRELNYLPCVMLFYRKLDNPSEVQVAFWREDGPSVEHETRFRELGGHELVGSNLLSKEPTGLAPEVVAHVNTYSSASPLIPASQAIAPIAANKAATVPSRTAEPSTGEDTIQVILCHEHPDLLRKALILSKKRLLIISPWIRHQVVDWEFTASLEALLGQGVHVYIGYGLEDGDVGGKGADVAKSKPSITPPAEKDLKQLAQRYKNFKFVFVGNTHRKTLVSDDTFAVVTSFNWLSFKGDPRAKPRDESGVLIRKKAYVDDTFEKSLSLLENGYLGKPPPSIHKQPSV